MWPIFGILCIITTVSADCGRHRVRLSDDFDRIVGGKDVKRGEFPWQVSLQKFYYGKFVHTCGGSILDEETILTAAHCIDRNESPDAISVVAGDHNLAIKEGSEQRISVSKAVIHENYKEFAMYDIGILKLKIPINMTSLYVAPICLPKASQQFREGEECSVSGWGFLNENRDFTSILQTVTLPIYSHTKCRKEYGTNRIHNYVLCAGYEQGLKDACQNDSGGPLTCKNSNGQQILAGIVSWGIGCARPNKSGVYTKVSEFVEWIEKNRV